MSGKRVVVVGTVRFSARCLEALVSSGANLVGVVTGNARVLARHADACSLEPIARAAGVASMAVDDINDSTTLAWIGQWAPDVLLVVGWSQLFCRELRALPAIAAIGAHPTLLPVGRGRHPIVWTLVNDVKLSGLTFFVLTDRADAGDIVLQESFPIGDEDDAGTVYATIERLAGAMIPRLVEEIESGLPNRRSQDEAAATTYRRRTAADGDIDWRMPAGRIRNLVRGLTDPYPGAHTFVRRDGMPARVIVWRATIQTPAGAPARQPGDVFVVGRSAFACTGDGWLRLDRYTSSASLQSGDNLGSDL